MNIEDIIGKGKAFEPPFKTDPDGLYIWDNNNQMILETRGFGHLQYLYNEDNICIVYITIANHIVELLNEKWYNNTNNQQP